MLAAIMAHPIALPRADVHPRRSGTARRNPLEHVPFLRNRDML